MVCHTFGPRAVLRVNDQVLIRIYAPISARKRFTLDQITRSPETQHEPVRKNAGTGSPVPCGSSL